MKLIELLQKCEYTVDAGSLDINIKDVIYDSRKVVKGCVFVALKGYNVDGHKFIPDAVERGAKALVVEDEGIAYDGVTVVRVKDARATLALMSVEFFGRPAEELTTIAVTGTKGKTTTVAMIRSILENAGIKTGTIGTLGILIGDRIYKTNNTTPESYEIQQRGVVTGLEMAPYRRDPLRLRHLHQLLERPYRRRRAQGYGGIPRLQSAAVSALQDRYHQHR